MEEVKMSNKAFTMSEYAERNGFELDLHDAAATRAVAAHLRKLGYERIRAKRGGRQVPAYRKPTGLADTLAAIEKKAGV